MKKKIAVIALAAFAIFGTAAYLHAHSVTNSLSDEGILHGGYPCSSCGGTGAAPRPKGWTGPLAKCFFCKGTGRNSSY